MTARLLIALALAALLGVVAVSAQSPMGPEAEGPEAESVEAAPPPEQVVAGLSQDAVAITTNFTGSEIIIYGAVKRTAPPPSGDPLGVIVTLQGPPQAVRVREKERRFGIWVNTSSLVIAAAPDFYVVATNAPLDRMLLPTEDVVHRITIPLAVRAFAGPVEVADTTDFTEALLRIREDQGRYRLDEGSVTLLDETLFRADIAMPANLSEGQYKASIFFVREGRVVSAYSAPILVQKVGLERWLYRLSLEQPFWYGLMSLAFAVAAGWGASAAFRAIQRK